MSYHSKRKKLRGPGQTCDSIVLVVIKLWQTAHLENNFQNSFRLSPPAVIESTVYNRAVSDIVWFAGLKVATFVSQSNKSRSN
jgi:hypothetical protein